MQEIQKGTLLENDDWYFMSISEMTEFKVSPYQLMYEWPYVDVVKMREYLVIKQTKEEAYRRDMKLQEGANG